MTPIAHIESPFSDKFGIPRQSGMSSVVCRIVFEDGFRFPEAVRGLDQFDFVWLLWRFDTDGLWHPTVRPPRLGGNRRIGVFSTRSPFRPNPIGLSSVRLLRVAFESCGPVLYVEGADLCNHTAIYDIKPYIPYADCHPDARCGFASQPADRRLKVVIPDSLNLPSSLRLTLCEILSLDPRPRYQDDPSRVYSLCYDGREVRFSVNDGTLTVLSALPVNQ